MKLLYAPGTCALATHIVLEWIGEPYELEKVHFDDPNFLKINPLGQVPTLINGDRIMSQGDALLKYLVRTYPHANLGDDGTITDGYELDHWLAFFTGDVHPAFFPFFTPKRYTVETSDHALKAVKEASYKLIAKVFTHLDQHLQGKEHITGNRRTVVDAYAFAMLRWGRTIPDALAPYPEIQRFFEVMLEDKSVQKAMQQQGIQ